MRFRMRVHHFLGILPQVGSLLHQIIRHVPRLPACWQRLTAGWRRLTAGCQTFTSTFQKPAAGFHSITACGQPMTAGRQLPTACWQRLTAPGNVRAIQDVRTIPHPCASALSKLLALKPPHHLPSFPDGHKCRRMHGHSFQVEVVVEGEIPHGRHYLVDYGDIKAAIDPIHDQLDHRCLNDIPGLENPTSEMIAKWIWEKLRPSLPLLAEISVHETCTSRCEYRGRSEAIPLPGDSNSGRRAT